MRNDDGVHEQDASREMKTGSGFRFQGLWSQLEGSESRVKGSGIKVTMTPSVSLREMTTGFMRSSGDVPNSTCQQDVL